MEISGTFPWNSRALFPWKCQLFPWKPEWKRTRREKEMFVPGYGSFLKIWQTKKPSVAAVEQLSIMLMGQTP